MMQRVIQTDDVLEIGAQWVKRGNKKLNRKKSRLENLKPDFIDIMQSKRGASSEIISYYNKTDDSDRKSIKQYNGLPDTEKSNYFSVRKYYCKLNEYTFIEYYSNNLSIRIHNLSYCDKSRYREIMQAITDSELFKFKHRTAYPTKTQISDATRAMLDRRFNIKKYEWGLIFDHSLSSVIHEALNRIVAKNIPGVRGEKNTVYLHESSSYKIKIYNITVADNKNRRDKEPEFRVGDRLKFEITYKTAFLTRKGLKIHHLKTQDYIADLLCNDNEKLFEKYFLRRLTPQEKRHLFENAKVSSESEFMELIRNSLVETSAEQKHGEIYSNSKQAIKSLVQQNNAQAVPLDEEKIQDMKERYKIPVYEKDMRKVRSSD